MSDGKTLNPGDFGAAFKEFLDEALASAPRAEPFFQSRLRSHFGVPPTGLPIVVENFALHDHASVQLALDSYLGESSRRFELVGVASDRKRMGGIGLGDLAGGHMASAPHEGPVDYVNASVADRKRLACVQHGLYLVHDGDVPLAVLVRAGELRGFGMNGVGVEVMAGERPVAERFLGEIRARATAKNVYRGHVVSLSQPGHGPLEVTFHELPPVGRDSIVLPAGVLERIERQTIRFAQLADRLRAASRHLKRDSFCGDRRAPARP